MIYRIEIRFDVEADNAEDAQERALTVAGKVEAEIGGSAEITAIFDEDFEEI